MFTSTANKSYSYLGNFFLTNIKIFDSVQFGRYVADTALLLSAVLLVTLQTLARTNSSFFTLCIINILYIINMHYYSIINTAV